MVGERPRFTSGNLLLELRVVETALGQATDEGHLAALKAETDAAAGAGFLALVALAAGLAVAAALAATETLGPVLGAGTGFESVKSHKKRRLERSRRGPLPSVPPNGRVDAAFSDRCRPGLIPRSFIASSRERSWLRASSVALTTLAWLPDPSDFASTSLMPAASTTARTPPPAITPVPGDAGRSSTRPPPILAQHLVRDRVLMDRHLDHRLAGASRPCGWPRRPRWPCRNHSRPCRRGHPRRSAR